MPRHYPLRILLSLVVVGMTVFAGINVSKMHGLPFVVNITDAHHAMLEPIKGIAFPAGLIPGDRLDPALQPRSTRIAIMANIGSVLPEDYKYNFVITRDSGPVAVPVTTVVLAQSTQERLINWIGLLFDVVLAGLALLVLWRGRDRAALGMAIWTVSALMASASNTCPLDGIAEAVLLSCTGFLYLLARIGFYVMADAVARSILGARTRAGFFMVFIIVLVAGASLFGIGGPLLYIFWGWAGGNSFLAGVVWSAAYLVPIALLMVCYQHALPAQRLRLRWMLISGVVFLLGIFLSNTTVFGTVGYLGEVLCLSLSVGGFLYAVLRHRVVDVSVLIDSTLVYGALTALVVGVLAAVNSLVEHAALGTSADLVLQLTVPLSLGIVLSRVRIYLDRNVERVFFRRKYEADRALRQFARLAVGYESADELLKVAIACISKHLHARGVAIYERRDAGYACVHQTGEFVYPAAVTQDDMAFVAARTGEEDMDLGEMESTLGSDGCVFPMLAHGELRGVLVVANRPGEHYAQDERRLLAHVAKELGLALYALEMRVKSKIIGALMATPAERLTEVQRTAYALLGASPE